MGFPKCELALCLVFECACFQNVLPTPRRAPGVTASSSAGVQAAEYQFCFVVWALHVLAVYDSSKETSGVNQIPLAALESERHKG